MRLTDPVHFSHLKHFAQSPAHYRASILEPRDPTPAMRFGSLVHAVLLSGAYIVWAGERRGNAWKEFRDAHSAAVMRDEGDYRVELIVTLDEQERALRCRDAIMRHPVAKAWILGGKHEVKHEWTTLGRASAGRMDVVAPDGVTELKTATDVHPVRFQWQARRMGYHAQVPWYLDGLGKANGAGRIVTVETKAPFDVVCHEMTPRQLEDGRKCYRLWMEQLLQCEPADSWPGYSLAPVTFDAIEESTPLLIDGEEVAA